MANDALTAALNATMDIFERGSFSQFGNSELERNAMALSITKNIVSRATGSGMGLSGPWAARRSAPGPTGVKPIQQKCRSHGLALDGEPWTCERSRIAARCRYSRRGPTNLPDTTPGNGDFINEGASEFVPKHHGHRAPAWALLLLVVVWLAGSALAFAGDSVESKETDSQVPVADAQALVEETTTALLTAFEREQASIRRDPTHAYGIVNEILSPHIDYPRVTRLILGKYWRQASPQQRQRFMDEFRALQVRTYATALIDYADIDIRYLPTRQARYPGRAIVRTQIPRRNGLPVSVDYRLHRADGRWKVYDVLVEGVSLLTSYRASIGAQIAQVGIDGVIEQLSAKRRGPVSPAQ
jgi:phospholipid transport system substrate-binding protein